MQIFEDDAVLTQNLQRAKALGAALAPLTHDARVTQVRQRGMIWACDVVLPPEAASTFSRRFFTTALQHELLLRPIGTTVYLMPPYVLDDAHFEFLGREVQAVMHQVLQEGIA